MLNDFQKQILRERRREFEGFLSMFENHLRDEGMIQSRFRPTDHRSIPGRYLRTYQQNTKEMNLEFQFTWQGDPIILKEKYVIPPMLNLVLSPRLKEVKSIYPRLCIHLPFQPGIDFLEKPYESLSWWLDFHLNHPLLKNPLKFLQKLKKEDGLVERCKEALDLMNFERRRLKDSGDSEEEIMLDYRLRSFGEESCLILASFLPPQSFPEKSQAAWFVKPMAELLLDKSVLTNGVLESFYDYNLRLKRDMNRVSTLDTPYASPLFPE